MKTNKTFDISADLPQDPFDAFDDWYAQAQQLQCAFPNAMTLASCKDGQPTARIVLLKSWDNDGFVFYSNYNSRKGEELAAQPRATLLFYWDALFRQIRIEGQVSKIARTASKAYFDSRPRESRIGAWASQQSQPLASRKELDDRVAHFEASFANREPDLPDHWGGYLLRPDAMEFWHGEYARLHQRRAYRRKDPGGEWQSQLLYP